MRKPARTPFSNSPAPNLKRYREIVSVLARHGFGFFLAGVQLEHRISLPSRLLKQVKNSNISPAEHLRLALEAGYWKVYIDGLSMLDFDMRYPPKYGLIHKWFMYTEGTSLISLY